MELLKVSAKSNPNMVAGAIAGLTRENKEVELQAIGAGSVNQAIKAIAVARAFLEQDAINIACIPGFTEINVGDDENRTAIRFTVIRI